MSVFMKRLYGPETFSRFVRDAVFSFSDIRAAHRDPDISVDFRHRILLAVTQVNGCRLCSYYHSKKALEGDITQGELASIMSGDLSGAPEVEHVALIFAEHYAETSGEPSQEAVERLVQAYGKQTARHVLALVRMIMVGNLHGNMIDAFKHRLKGQAVADSSLGREVAIVFGVPFYFAKAAFQAIANRNDRHLSVILQ